MWRFRNKKSGGRSQDERSRRHAGISARAQMKRRPELRDQVGLQLALALSQSEAEHKEALRSEDELHEEEELELALALSLSEADYKEKEKKQTATMMSSVAATRAKHQSPPTINHDGGSGSADEDMDPELARYLNRSFWMQRKASAKDKEMVEKERMKVASPSAPAGLSVSKIKIAQENGETDAEVEDFISALKYQMEIFVNRMKSSSNLGRSVTNDSSVQTLFLNITAMHSRLLGFIQEQDDSRQYYEKLQDKLTQIKDIRAALHALREEHREMLQYQSEEAERIRHLQMAQKIEITRKNKQEYLQYQQQLALQNVQKQEREMQIRQDQQKQQYLLGSYPYAIQYIPPGQLGTPNPSAAGSPVHGQFRPQGPMMLPSTSVPGQYPQMISQAYSQYGVPLPPGSVRAPGQGPRAMQMPQQVPLPGCMPPEPQPSSAMPQTIRDPVLHGPMSMVTGPIPMQSGQSSSGQMFHPPAQMMQGPMYGPGSQNLPGSMPPKGHMPALGPLSYPTLSAGSPIETLLESQGQPLSGPQGGLLPGPQGGAMPGSQGGPILGPQAMIAHQDGLAGQGAQGGPMSGPQNMPDPLQSQQFHPQQPTQSAPPGSPQQPLPSQQPSQDTAELISFD